MTPETKLQDQYKQQAARSAVEFINDGMIVGLGHGSTALFAVEEVAGMIRGGKLKNIVGVACSVYTDDTARKLGIPMKSLNEVSAIDLVIDGADEIDRHLNMIKGGGGAMLREKMVAELSRRRVYIADESKLSSRIGTLRHVPVEVVPLGWKSVVPYLESLGAKVTLRCSTDGKPAMTDQGNYILDSNFGPIEKPDELSIKLKGKAGIVEHGLFLNLATDVIVAGPKGIQHLRK